MFDQLLLNNLGEKFQSCSQNKSLEWMKFELVVYESCARIAPETNLIEEMIYKETK